MKDEDCPQVKKECKYCELDIARGVYDEHVEGCGSRTDFCELCNQRVMLRDMQEHLENKCKMPSREEDTSPPSYFAGLGLNSQDLVNTGAMPHHHSGFNMNDLMLPPYQGRLHPPASQNQASVHVDTQWLTSVREACGSDDDLDQVLAQNLNATEGVVGGFVHRSVSSSSSSNSDANLDRGEGDFSNRCDMRVSINDKTVGFFHAHTHIIIYIYIYIYIYTHIIYNSELESWMSIINSV